MALQSEKFKVGVFILCSGVMLLGFLAFVVGKSFFRDQLEYQINFEESVKGLTHGAQVNYHGVPVGTVGKMRLAGNTTVVTIMVKSDACMIQREVTKAALERNPVTGLATITLEGFSDNAPSLVEGQVIPSVPSWGSEVIMTFPKLMKEVPKTLESINNAAESIDRLLSEELHNKLVGVLGKLDSLAGRIGPAIERVSTEAANTMAVVKQSVDGLSKVLAELDGKVGGLVDRAGTALTEAASTLQSGRKLIEGPEVKQILVAVRDAAKGLGKTVGRISNLARTMEGDLGSVTSELGPLAVRLSQMAAEISRLARRLGNNPSDLVWSAPRPERKIPDPAAGRKRQVK